MRSNMELLAVIFGVAGLIWGAVLLKRGGLLAGCLVVLLAGACFSEKFFKLSWGPVPLSIDRLLFVVLVGQYLLWRRFGWADLKPLAKVDIVLIAFLALLIAGTFLGEYSTENYRPVAWLILYYLMPFGVYWIARQSDLTSGTSLGNGVNSFGTKGVQAKRPSEQLSCPMRYSLFANPLLCLLICFAAFGAYLSITAIFEHYEIWGLVFPRYIGETALEPGAEFVGRARGPFLHAIGEGIALAICLGALLMVWYLTVYRGSTPRSNQKELASLKANDRLGEWDPCCMRFRYARLGHLFFGPLFLLFAVAIFTTLTRSVWMGGAFVLAVVVGLALPWSWRMPLLLGGLLVAVVVSVASWDRLMEFKRDKNLDADKTAESVELRPVLARIAWNMFRDRPLFGCGYGQYEKEHLNYLSDRSSDLVLEKGRPYIQHNVVFSLLTQTGLVGVGLFLVVNVLWGIDAWRLWQSTAAPLPARQIGLLMLAALGVYFINGMFHDVSVIPMANMTLFFLAGMTEGLRPEIKS